MCVRLLIFLIHVFLFSLTLAYLFLSLTFSSLHTILKHMPWSSLSVEALGGEKIIWFGCRLGSCSFVCCNLISCSLDSGDLFCVFCFGCVFLGLDSILQLTKGKWRKVSRILPSSGVSIANPSSFAPSFGSFAVPFFFPPCMWLE